MTHRLAFGREFAKLARLKNWAATIKSSHRYLLALLAGVLLATPFPPFNLAGAAWVTPALVLACAWGQTGGAAWRVGYVAGLAHWLTLLLWLLEIPVRGFPILGWIALAAFLAIYPAFWVWILAGKIGHGSWLRRCFWALGGAAAWVALEMIRSRFLSGFPWNTLGASQWQMVPLIQLAAITGVYGVSFLAVWMALSLYSSVLALLRHPTTRYIWLGEIALPVIVVMLVFNLGLIRVRQAAAPSANLLVTFVQPAVPQTMIWDAAENTNRLNSLLALTKTALANKTDLLLWPEAALPELTDETFAALTNIAAVNQTWLMFNADDVLPKAHPTAAARFDIFNAALLINPHGEFAGSYHKRQLVIFGEYIPLANYLPFIKWFTPITGGYTAGQKVGHFKIANHKIAPLICFEDTFGHHVRKHVDNETDLLVNLTNDGWFGEKAAQWQHLAAAAFRSVENGVPLLRCCNTGITCWFDGYGRLQQTFRTDSGSVYGAGFANWLIEFAPASNRTATIYNRVGDRFGWSCVGVTVGLLLWRFKTGRAKLSRTQ